MLPRRLFAIFSGLGSTTAAAELQPTLKVQSDREVYRPGDQIVITVEISNPSSSRGNDDDDTAYSLLIERLGFEIKGIEKLDSQWFATQKAVPGSKQRRGEYVFMEASTSALVTNQIVSPGATKSCIRMFIDLKGVCLVGCHFVEISRIAQFRKSRKGRRVVVVI